MMKKSGQMTQQKNNTLTLINPKELYDPSTFYSHIALLNTPAKLLFISGQAGEYADGSRSDNFSEQVIQSFINLRIALTEVGADINHIIKMTVFITDHSLSRLKIYEEILNKVFGELPKPACTLIPLTKLALPNMLFEVEAIAYIPEEKRE